MSCPCECDGYCGVLSIINGEPYSIDGKYAYQNGKTDPNCPIVELTE